jgi:RNA polymerase sigma-70 factor, ECF subfamily
MIPRDASTEELLVLAAQAGDREAFAALAQRWHPRLLAVARAVSPSPVHAEDVVQVAWVAIVRGLSSLQSPAAFGGWAARIVRNTAASHARRRSTAQRAHERGPAPRAPASQPRDPALARALEALSVDHRAVVELRYGADLGLAEIARLLEVPTGTVKSRLHHARRQLRRLLEDPHA